MKNIIKKQTGFTLAELMVTVAVAAIIMTIGIPMLRVDIQNARINTVTNDLVSALMMARSEAIRQTATTCVCPSTTVNNAVPACAANGNWETGWIAFSDFNGDCAINGVNPNADVLIKAVDGSLYNAQIRVRTNSPSISAVNSVQFNARGEPFAAGAIQNGSFSINDDRPINTPDAKGNVRTAAAVIVSSSGRARASRQASQITYTAP